MHRIFRGLLVSAVLAGAAGLWVGYAAKPVTAETPPVVTAAADRLTGDAVAALRRGEYDRTSELLRQAATSSNDPALHMMASWVASFSDQYDKTLAQRKSEYDKAVSQVKLLQQHGKQDYALDAATKAYSFALDKKAFRNEAWVDDLVKDRAAAATQYEKDGQWILAARVYLDLGVIEPSNAVWKNELKTAGKYVGIEALYTPEYFKKIQKSRLKEDDEVEGLLRKANLLSDATTRPATDPAEEDALSEAKMDWHDVLKDIDFDLVPSALRDAQKNWYREVSYQQLALGGLRGLRVLATAPGIEQAFPSLGDAAKRDRFVQAIDNEIAAVKDNPNLDYSDTKELITRVRNDNETIIQLPENVIVYEFTNGALGEMDQFSSMIWPQMLEEFTSSIRGEFSGVGVQIERDVKTGYLKVVTPIEDTPAYKAGIKAGNFITQVNGEPVKKMLLDQAVKKIKGPTGSRVTLTVLGDDGTSKDYTLKRDTVRVASIKGWKRDQNGGWDWMVDPVQRIGYVRLTSFSESCADDLEHALKQMQATGTRGVIMDLRGDPGGLLPAAVDVADKFIPSGTIVSTKADRETPQAPQISVADPDTKKIKMPLIVLVNQFSASASEIVAGALKDHHRAIIVGERTYGKGSVQMPFPTPSRKARLKITTAHYYLPSGRCLHREETSTEWGVDPDYAIEMTPEQVKAINDARQEMDVLYIPGEQPKPQPTTKPANLLDVDPQLSAAVMLMRLEVAGVKL